MDRLFKKNTNIIFDFNIRCSGQRTGVRVRSHGEAHGNPEIALFFIVPGIVETLRVSGRAQIIHDDPRLDRCAINGQVPVTGILVNVHKACLQCGKALKRSALWDDTYRVNRKDLPSFGKMLADQTDTGKTAQELDRSIDDAYENRLY